MSIKPKLGLFDTTMVVISLVIGIGIFRTPSIVARNTGNTELFFLAWVIGGIICLLGGLIFAEIGGRKSFAGGYYKVVSEAYNPAIAFMLNWLGISITSGATFAAVSIIASEYLIQAIGDIQPFVNPEFLKTITGKKIVAGILVFILFFINYLGIKSGAIFLNIITVLKILTILFFIIISFFYPSGHNSSPENEPTKFVSNGLYASLFGFFLGLRAVFFTVGGYQLTTNLSADVKNHKKNLPLAIVSGVVLVILLYLFINFSYYKLLGFEGISKSDLIAADMADLIFGSLGSRITSIIILISAIGYMNATIMHTPRAYHAMATDKVLPKIFMKINEKNQVQEFGLIFMFTLVIFFIITQEGFEKILNVIMFNDLLSIAITASVIFVFRHRERKLSEKWEGYKSPLYPILPVIFIVFLLLVSIRSFYEDFTAGIVSLGVFFLGYPIYKTLNKKLNN